MGDQSNGPFAVIRSLQNRWPEDGKKLPLADIRQSQNEGWFVNDDVIVVHLPFSTLKSGERSCELPPRHVEFDILVDESMDLQEIQEFFGATVSKATQQSRKPWRIRHVWMASEEKAKPLGLNPPNGINSTQDFQPLPRLWQPDQLLPRRVWPHLKSLLLSEKRRNQDISRYEVWDLGSGAGRDVCYLAEQLKVHQLNCTVVGIDNHKASAQRCVPLWERRGVGAWTEARNLDLNKLDQRAFSNEVICLYAVRFLNRKLLSYIAANAPPGTLFGMSHFCKASPDASWTFDHPKVSRQSWKVSSCGQLTHADVIGPPRPGVWRATSPIHERLGYPS